MDFWVDIAFSVLFRLLKNNKQRGQYIAALAKLYNNLSLLRETDVAFRQATEGSER